MSDLSPSLSGAVHVALWAFVLSPVLSRLVCDQQQDEEMSHVSESLTLNCHQFSHLFYLQQIISHGLSRGVRTTVARSTARRTRSNETTTAAATGTDQYDDDGITDFLFRSDPTTTTHDLNDF